MADFRGNNCNEQLWVVEGVTADAYYGMITNIDIYQFLVTRKDIR